MMATSQTKVPADGTMPKIAGGHPSVAVIIPCYNHGAFLPDALASVRNQAYPHVTCVVVDDGSADPGTRQLMDELRRDGIDVVSQPNQGLAAARNAGVRATNAPFFVPLDADDKLHPQFIERLLPPLLEDERLGYAYCQVRLFAARTGTWRCPPYVPYRLILHNLSTATTLVRREAFDAVGGYQVDMVHRYEDWDFFLALLAAGFHGRLVPDILFQYRQHAPGISMLGRTEATHDEMVRRMIAHHYDLYCKLLGLTQANEEQVFGELAAAVELDRIETSRSWRWLNVFSADARRGRDSDGTPSQCLANVKASKAYRLIQAVKRTRLHKWYATRKYGQLPSA